MNTGPSAYARLYKTGLACLILGGIVGCAQLEPRPELPMEVAVPPAESGPLDRLIAPAEARHPNQSAFRLVSEGPEAFAILVRSAELAVRSLDVQTYIWQPDDTGILLEHALIEAADRGVTVRLLLDDLDARPKNGKMAALDAHPHIHVRMFNPFATRWDGLRLIGEGLTN